jgi:lysophospholipase L1-like esterase
MTIHGRIAWRGCVLAALVWALAWSPLRADPISLATLGDSITDTYAGKPYAGTNQSWTDQLRSLRPADVNLTNLARAGSTSTDLLTQGQDTTAANLIQEGKVRYATLIIGANDVGAFLQQINPNNPATLDPAPFIQKLLGNISTVVNKLQFAGDVGIVLANLPDIGNTPFFLTALAKTPAILQLLTAATNAANTQIEALAKERGLPLVDLYSLNNLSKQPTVTLGGINVKSFLYSVDGFHPSTIGSGVIANAELEALRRGYNVNVQALSDREILRAAGLQGKDGFADFNVGSFVITQNNPEPSSFVLAGLGGFGLLGIIRRRTK